jgi:hypothetical protein
MAEICPCGRIILYGETNLFDRDDAVVLAYVIIDSFRLCTLARPHFESVARFLT